MKEIKQLVTKTLSIVSKIWKDPVWSKVIAGLILILIATIWALINKYSISNIYGIILLILNYEIPVYIILFLLVIFFLTRFIIWKFKRNAIWKEKIGDYTFKELCDILQSQTLPFQTRGMEMRGIPAPQHDLLFLFYRNIIFFNAGVDNNRPGVDGGYLIGILCPRLVSYGLLERIDYKGDLMDLSKYQTTELGKKFYRLLEKAVLLKKIYFN